MQYSINFNVVNGFTVTYFTVYASQKGNFKVAGVASGSTGRGLGIKGLGRRWSLAPIGGGGVRDEMWHEVQRVHQYLPLEGFNGPGCGV